MVFFDLENLWGLVALVITEDVLRQVLGLTLAFKKDQIGDRVVTICFLRFSICGFFLLEPLPEIKNRLP
jgi:hypothetical protein